MRFTACTVVVVLGISLDAVAQPPAHAHGKANGHAHAYGHAKRADFAANAFKVGLQPAANEAPGKKGTPTVQLEAPRATQSQTARSPAPDCISR